MYLSLSISFYKVPMLLPCLNYCILPNKTEADVFKVVKILIARIEIQTRIKERLVGLYCRIDSLDHLIVIFNQIVFLHLAYTIYQICFFNIQYYYGHLKIYHSKIIKHS